MKEIYLALAISAALMSFLVAGYFYNGNSPAVTRNTDATLDHEARLMHGRCTKTEEIDRWLLQQSWFYDQQFTDVAGAFGQSSFGMFERGSPKHGLIEAAFCIEGRNLIVRYFREYYIPSGFEFRSPFDWTIKFSSKLIPLDEDVFVVQELSKRRMILKFASDGSEHVFYRKN